MIYLLGCFLFIGNATSASDSSWWCCYKKTDTRPQPNNTHSEDYHIFYDSDTQKNKNNPTITHNPIVKKSSDQSQGMHKASAIAMHELKNVVSDVNRASISKETEV